MLSKKLIIELKKFIEGYNRYTGTTENKAAYDSCQYIDNSKPLEIGSFIQNRKKPSFATTLFRYIDTKKAIETEVYKKAGIDRRHFSKIRSIPDYHPKKHTIIALALALKLNKKETDNLLSSAGYSLSDSETYDLIILFFIEKSIYNISDINQALDYFSQKPLLGACI